MNRKMADGLARNGFFYSLVMWFQGGCVAFAASEREALLSVKGVGGLPS